MSTTISSNMNLPVPGVGNEDGPQWATDLNNCMGIIDAHDHTSGSGVQIPPGGLNINSDFTQNNQNLINIKSLRFFTQPSALVGASDLNCLFNVGVDLYFNDGNGNHVRITQSGAVAGTPGSISSLVSPASASYNGGSSTFVWQSDVNIAANMDGGSVILRNLTVSSKGLTLSPPTSMGADYTLTLPGLPASTMAMNLTSSGTIGTISYDAIGQAMTATGANSIAAARTRSTGTTVGAGGIAISTGLSSSFAFSTTPTDITNTVTITTSGRPVFVRLSNVAAGGDMTFIYSSGDFNYTPEFYLNRDGSTVNQTKISLNNLNLGIPPSSISFIDVIGAGTYVYKIRIRGKLSGTTAGTFSSDTLTIEAFEL